MSERKARTHAYYHLIDLLMEPAMEKENDSHMNKYGCKHMLRETAAERNPGGRLSQPHSHRRKGQGGQLKHMQEAPPSNGKALPHLFYCRLMDHKGRHCHAPDCDVGIACMLQLQRKEKKNGKEVKHKNHIRCTMTCRFCGKRRHYDNECHIERRESEKHKKAEEEKRPKAGKDNPNGGGNNPQRSPGKGNTGGGRRSSAPPTGWTALRNHASKFEQHAGKGPAPRPPLALAAPRRARTPRSGSSTSTLSACRLPAWR